jgi:ethanolamine ammonia-lyase small subunit
MDDKLSHSPWPELMEEIRVRTPARVLAGRTGASYRTETQLELRHAHAAARDAVRREFDLERDLGPGLVREWKLFAVSTTATSKDEYLQRPDLGRRLNDNAQRELLARCTPGADLQIVIGDGLSVTAVSAQVPALLPCIAGMVGSRGWKMGQPFAVHYCRVGIMNDIGELLRPNVVVLLIGERPGLATAGSLSAYMAYRPRAGHNDSNRNLISNIHERGVKIEDAAARTIGLAERMLRRQTSGVELKEELVPPKWLK